ncbi:putative exosome complex component RRP41 [Dictyocoela roeselum]|nr:putative exosome complex component RRP41 [Dictyocoela roeselum]
MEILDKHGFRSDGRKPTEMRRLYLSFKTLNNNPVLEYTQGLTKLRTTIIGPKSGNKRDKINPLLKFNSFSKQDTATFDYLADEYESIIVRVFNNVLLLESPFFVEAQVDIIEDNGSALSAIINSISITMAYAGIPMKDIVLSLTNGFYDAKVFCDITANEESNRIPAFTVAYLPMKQMFVGVRLKGHIHQNNLVYLFEQSVLFIAKLYSVVSKFLRGIENEEKLEYSEIK